MASRHAPKEVTVEEARQQFDKLIARVRKDGAKILIKENGDVVARIVPSSSHAAATMPR